MPTAIQCGATRPQRGAYGDLSNRRPTGKPLPQVATAARKSGASRAFPTHNPTHDSGRILFNCRPTGKPRRRRRLGRHFRGAYGGRMRTEPRMSVSQRRCSRIGSLGRLAYLHAQPPLLIKSGCRPRPPSLSTFKPNHNAPPGGGSNLRAGLRARGRKCGLMVARSVFLG